MQVSKNTPFYFLTTVTHKRLPVFRLDSMKQILCNAFAEVQSNHHIFILAYVIMAEHYHLIVNGPGKTESETLRLLNGVSARRVIQHLKAAGHESSLAKLRIEERGREHKHSLWEHHSNTFAINTESVLMQKVNYIHWNPVEDNLAAIPEEYRYSSARFWKGRPDEDEPLEIQAKKIVWRQSR